MILNRVNYENENREKDINEDEEDNNNEEEENEEEERQGEEKEEEKETQEEREGEEEVEEEREKEGDNEGGEEEAENEDNNKHKMIKTKEGSNEKYKYKPKKKLSKLKKILMISSFFIILLLFLIIIINAIRKRRKLFKGNKFLLKSEIGSNERYNKIKSDLMNAYDNNKELNVINFYYDNIIQKSYIPPDTSNLKNVHINVGFSENDIDTAIKHISSALHHAADSTYLHIHMMDADTFSIESLMKLKNMVFKVNNKTEIIVYNAAEALKSFTIKEEARSNFAKEYAKLYAFKAIKNVQKIIFLDADDCIVVKDLEELYNLEMNDIYGRGVLEIPSLRFSVDWMEPYLYDKSHYINGGVILVNLELCQKDDFYTKAIELNNNEFYKKTEEPAQDILNVLMKRKIEFFHPRYNKVNYYEKEDDKNDESKWYPWVIETLKQTEKNNHFYTKEELIEADKDPVIIHYYWEKKLNKEVKKYEYNKKFYANLVGL
jgi:lipopolysaccharide biosynthesis glycosyltransferase